MDDTHSLIETSEPGRKLQTKKMTQRDPGNLEETAGKTAAEVHIERIEDLLKNIITDEELEEIQVELDELRTVADQPPTTYIDKELDQDEITELHDSAMDW